MTPRRWACAGVVAGSLVMAAPAWSQTYVGVPPPIVKSDQAVRSEAPPPAPAARGGLAFTGADIAELVAIGAFGASAGALSVRLGRKRPELASLEARPAGGKRGLSR